MRIVVFLILFLALANSSKAQDSKKIQKLDSLSYQYYLNKDISNLKKTYRTITNSNVDFFYLEMRLGILYYERQNYEKALIHFNKAYQMNPENKYLHDYLYFTYRFLNLYGSADNFAIQHNLYNKESVRKYISYPFLSKISMLYGETNNSQKKYYDDLFSHSNIPLYEADIQGNTDFVELFIENYITKRIKLYNQISFINTKSYSLANALISDNENINNVSGKSYKNNNIQYTIGLEYISLNNFNIILSGGLYRECSQSLLHFTDLESSDSIMNYEYKKNNIFGNLSISKRLKYVMPGFRLAVSNLGDYMNYLTEANLAIYPFGNSNYYSYTSLSYLNSDLTHNFIFKEELGFKLFKGCYISVNYSEGNHKNLITNDGFVIYNTIDPIYRIIGTKLSYHIGKIDIIPIYSFMRKKNSSLRIDQETEIKNSYYNNNQIVIQCILNF